MGINSLSTEEQINEVVELYSETVYRLAISYTGSKYNADDIFQEVFIRLIHKKPIFNDEEHRKAWLIRVTINCCKKQWGSAWNRKNISLDENVINQMTFELEEEGELFYAIQKLPLNYKTVIHLFYYEDMSTKEIAKILNTLETTIRSRLARARKQLKIMLKEE